MWDGRVHPDEVQAKGRVVVLPSGLRYRILKATCGEKPDQADSVECAFRGILLSTQFDSSYRPGQPATLRLRDIIPGLSEALQIMTVGSRWQLFIPPNLAYGAGRAGSTWECEGTLSIEIELLAIR